MTNSKKLSSIRERLDERFLNDSKDFEQKEFLLQKIFEKWISIIQTHRQEICDIKAIGDNMGLTFQTLTTNLTDWHFERMNIALFYSKGFVFFEVRDEFYKHLQTYKFEVLRYFDRNTEDVVVHIIDANTNNELVVANKIDRIVCDTVYDIDTEVLKLFNKSTTYIYDYFDKFIEMFTNMILLRLKCSSIF